MRTLTISTVFFFGFSAILIAQGPRGGGQGGTQSGPPGAQNAGQRQAAQAPVQVQIQQGGQRPQGGQGGGGQWQGQPQMQPGGPGGGQRMPGMQPPGGQFPGGPAAQGAPGGRPMPPAAGQANQNQPPRPAPPAPGAAQQGALNPNQVTQMIARLRALDTSQTGVLNLNNLPANQQAQVTNMVTRLGGDPSRPVNIANLERRAIAAAGGTPQQNQQPNQQQQQGGGQQQRQQPVVPLVPTFGEQIAAELAPLGFGQRDRVNPATPQQANRGGGGQQQRGGQNNQQGAVPPPVVVKISTPYDNIPAILRTNREFAWFFEFDTNQDGQITMAEYVAGCGGVWTETIAGEFSGFGRKTDINGVEYFDVGLDRNGDGYATMDEVLLTVKERSERRALETAATAQAAGPVARPQGQPTQQQGRQPTAVTQANANPRQPPQGNAVPNQGQGRQPPTANNQGNFQPQGRVQGGQNQGGGQQMGPGGRGNQPGGGGARGNRGGG